MIELEHPLRLVFPQRTREDFVYLPMSFIDPDVILGPDMLCISGANLYIFGVLTSSVHRAWIRMVGRFEDGFLVYDPCMVYNTFPWPEVGKAAVPAAIDATLGRRQDGGSPNLISATAQAVLDARAAHPEMSLGVLYSAQTMPADLRAAHEANDAAVLAAYGLPLDVPEADIQTLLLNRYTALIGGEGDQRLAANNRPHRRFHAHGK